MKITSILLFSIFALLSSSLCAQNSITKKGDKLLLKGEYFAAMECYKKAEAEGLTLDVQTTINKAICYYNLNDIDNAFTILNDNQDKLQGDQIFLFALASHKFGFYEGAIDAYEKAKKAGSNPTQIDELIAACKWAQENQMFNQNVRVNPVSELYTGGLSFGIQYYKGGVVYSSASEEGGKKTLDKQGYEILNLYYSEIVDGKIQPTKRIFSKKLIYPTHIGSISFTSDNSMMYYSRAVRAKGGESILKVFSVEYDGKDWGNETELPINNDAYSCTHPAVSPDNRFLYFVSNKPGGYGGKDIYYCERSKNGSLGEVKNAGSEINTFGDEVFPFISKENVLIFSSDGRNGFGGLDLYTATKNGDKWGNITNMLKPFNDTKDDFGYVIDPTNPNRGFMSSTRLGVGNNDAIFSVDILSTDEPKVEEPVVEKPVETPVESPIETPIETPVVIPVVVPPVVEAPKVILPTSLSAAIISTFNGTPVSGAKIELKDLTTGMVVGTATSDASGKFSLTIPEGSRVEDREFEIMISKGTDFNAKKMVVNIMEIEELNKSGFSLTPIFNNPVLDDISGMVIPYVGTQITPEGEKTIDALAAYMLKNPNIVIKLNGHTEARGDKLANLNTSQQMAEKIEKLMIQKGVQDENIIPRSYGERYIINKCKRGVTCDNATHLVNRRVEVVVWRMLK